MKRALQYIAANLPYQPNISKLSEVVELNRNTLLQYLVFLEKAGVILSLFNAGSFYGKLTKPGKILLHDPNLAFALSTGEVNHGHIRECFFTNQVSRLHKVELANKGDFLVSDRYIFEIGGKGKTRKQVAGVKNSYVITDNTEFGFEHKIPLWMFGFLY